MNRHILSSAGTLLLIALTSLAGTACNNESRAASPGGGRPPAVVETAPVEQGSFNAAARFVGRLRGESTAELFARTEGPLVAVYAGSGDPVKRGQVLALIEPDEARQRVEQQRAALRMSEATLQQRAANLEVATANARRSESLFNQNLVSQSAHDMAQAEMITARSQLELSRAQIEQAQANLNAAMLQLQQTKIVAPFAGFIGTRHLDLGAHATTNRPVFSLVDVDPIRTSIAIPAQEAVRIRKGQTAIVIPDVLSDRRFEGQVSRISSVVDSQTNTVEAEVEVKNESALLKPGMYASVLIAYDTSEAALLVPAAAVQRNEHEQWIFVAEPGEEGLSARRVAVRVLQSADSQQASVAVEPLAGVVSPGDQVIVLGQEGLVDGARVTLAGAPAKGAGR